MLHIVVAIIRDEQNRILIAQRPSDKHQGGKWEFSGGKVEAEETAQQALRREINEELGIQIETIQPLIQIRHNYPDLAVFLDVYNVKQWRGEAYGKEGQVIRWVDIDALSHYRFPSANKAIIQALQLPDLCLITPDIVNDNEFKQGILNCLEKGVKLIQYRAKNTSESNYIKRAKWLSKQCEKYHCMLVLNSPPAALLSLAKQGLHLTSHQLLALKQRPETLLLSAACHNEVELHKAQELGVDFVFLSPIKATRSHPNAKGKGWQWFKQAVQKVNLPVYALGGLGENHLLIAKENGAQGIAAISQLWDNSPFESNE